MSKRKDVAVYIHSKNYPSEAQDEHEYALGNIPHSVLKRMFQMHSMKEIFQVANPYIFLKQLNEVMYYPSFRHFDSDIFHPENKEKLNHSMIA